MSSIRRLVGVLSGSVAVCFSLLLATGAWADEAIKVTTAASDAFIIMMMGPTEGMVTTPFSTILSTSIKLPASNDLLITVSAGTRLITTNSALVPGGGSLADAAIGVQVLVDGVPVMIGSVPSASVVTWDDQFREVTQFVPAGAISTEDELSIFGVHAFTFTQPNVGPGSHLVEVQANYSFTDVLTGGEGSSFTESVVGPRTLVVEAVKLQ